MENHSTFPLWMTFETEASRKEYHDVEIIFPINVEAEHC